MLITDRGLPAEARTAIGEQVGELVIVEPD